MNTPYTPQIETRHTLKKVVWLLVALFLLIAFFLPNYTTPIIDFSGFDLLKGVIKKPESFNQLFQDAPTFFMVITPFTYWTLGFFTLTISISSFTSGSSTFDRFIIIMAGMLIFLSITTAIVMTNRHDLPSIFAKALPKPNLIFYLTIIAEATLILTGILGKASKKVEN
ncbi:MAG TPA: hypothetical protein ENJ82_18260 [Bacteroidetes bacterium]|nr:hypothetical protein [Bacteroidota bacterium]